MLRGVSSGGGGGGMAVGGTVTGGTTGSVLFIDGSGNLGQDNANFFWDDSNNRLGLLTTGPTHTMTQGSTATGSAWYASADQVTNIQRLTVSNVSSVFTLQSVGLGASAALPLTIQTTSGGLAIKYTQTRVNYGGAHVFTNTGGAGPAVGDYFAIQAFGSSSTAEQVVLNATSTWTQTSTGAYTMVKANAIETTTGSGNKNLYLGQVGSVDKWRIDNTGSSATYKGVATTGWGAPAIYGSGRSTAQTAAVGSVATYTVGAADGTFLVSANVLVTTATTHAFTATCAYTDEGNTARTLTLTFSNVGGTLITSITNAGGTVPYEGVPLQIRCKAATAITIATTGTFTTVTYNVEGYITQIG